MFSRQNVPECRSSSGRVPCPGDTEGRQQEPSQPRLGERGREVGEEDRGYCCALIDNIYREQTWNIIDKLGEIAKVNKKNVAQTSIRWVAFEDNLLCVILLPY